MAYVQQFAADTRGAQSTDDGETLLIQLKPAPLVSVRVSFFNGLFRKERTLSLTSGLERPFQRYGKGQKIGQHIIPSTWSREAI